MRQHCPRCGSYCTPAPENRSLLMTRAGLPLPPAGDPFFAVIAQSQKREAEALSKARCRDVGAERKARFAFTHQALRGGQ